VRLWKHATRFGVEQTQPLQILEIAQISARVGLAGVGEIRLHGVARMGVAAGLLRTARKSGAPS
jgi:hypothetical protein